MIGMAQNSSHDLYAIYVGNGIYSFAEEGCCLLEGSHCLSQNKLRERNSSSSTFFLEICICYAPVSSLSCTTPLQSPCLAGFALKAGYQAACSYGIPCFLT